MKFEDVRNSEKIICNEIKILRKTKKQLVPNRVTSYISYVRIISLKRLKEFWEKPKYTDSEVPLKIWINQIKKGNWQNSNELLGDFPDADNVVNRRIVFNIKHNSYRLIVMFRYRIQICYIRFIGTHKEYDKIKNIKEI